MAKSSESKPTLGAEQEYADRKLAEREAYQRKRQQAEDQLNREERWKEVWQALERTLETWAANCTTDTIHEVASSVVALAQELQELGYEQHVRIAVKRLDRLYQKDPSGNAVDLCDLPEVRIICRWALQVMDGARISEIVTRVEKLPPTGDFARGVEPASFEIMHAPQLDRTDEFETKDEGEWSVKWKRFASRFREVLSNNGDEHPILDIKEICVEIAIAMSQISSDGKSWLPAPAATRKYRLPPKTDDWDAWGDIWQLGLQQILSSYPFPQELPTHLLIYDPWKYGTAFCDRDWRAGVKRYAEFCDWQKQKYEEAEEQRQFFDVLNKKQESVTNVPHASNSSLSNSSKDGAMLQMTECLAAVSWLLMVKKRARHY